MKQLTLLVLCAITLTACEKPVENHNSSVTIELEPAKGPVPAVAVKRNSVGEVEGGNTLGAEDGFNAEDQADR